MNLAQLRFRHVVSATTLVLMLGGAAAHGQRPQGGGGGTMIVDFSAVTADGKLVTELNPADITIKIGGKARTVTALTLKRIEAAPTAGGAPAAAMPSAAAATPAFFTNDPAKLAAPPPAAGGRSFMILVDTDSLQAGTEAVIKTAIDNLLKGLTDADRVAFSIAPRDTAQVGFGTGLPKVREAVAALRGQRPANVSTADALCRTSDTLNLMQGLLEPLAGNENPTAFVFIAASLSTSGSASGTSGGTCAVTNDQYMQITRAAAIGKANIYVVNGDQAVARNDGLDNLAGVTGGAVTRVVGDGFAPKVLAEASAYWVATVAPDPADRPGQSQRLELKAVKAGVTVHGRPEAAVSVSRSAAAAAPKSGTTSPKDMNASTAAFTDLQLRAIAYSSRGAADKMTVLVLAEPVDPAVKISAMAVRYFDQAGQGASLTPPQIVTYPIATPMSLGVGQYRVRVSATDSTGKSGAVDVTVNTTLTAAGPLRLGGMLLGAMTDKGLSPRLTFGPDDKLMAFFEMYGQITAGIEVHFEVAASDTGPALEGLNAIKAAGGASNEADKFNINAEIPTAKLAPGDYVVRAHVKMAGEPEGRVIRTFRKIEK